MFGYKIVKEIDIKELEDKIRCVNELYEDYEKLSKNYNILREKVMAKDNIIRNLKGRIKDLCKSLDTKSENSSGCKRGPQCEDCSHFRRVYMKDEYQKIIKIDSYCAKCVHDECPSWERVK